MCESRRGRSFDRMTPLAELKKTHRATWAAGDYPAVAQRIDDVPPRDLLDRIGVGEGDDVLDVATGTGHVALRAAAAGANVVALDLTPELFATAWRRMDEWGVAVDWVEGDAEELPFDDESFDAVLSVFGVQFAPRHDVVAHELARVTRPGGRIGLVNWTPEGLVGGLFKIMGSYLPRPPAYASPPPLWGNDSYVRGLFAGSCIDFEFARGRNPWHFESADAWVGFMGTHYGPTLKAREKLAAEGRWEPCRDELVALAKRHNEA